MSLFGSKILCPFCFKYVSVSDLRYLCHNGKCLDNNELGGRIIPKKVARPDKNGYCECERCHRTTSTTVCPNCMTILPHEIALKPTHVISIVGAASSGKSYYIGALMKKIMEESLFSEMTFENINTMSTIWADKKSPEEYIRRFKTPIDNHVVLPGTEKYTDIVKDNPPLLIEMSIEKKKIERTTFSFFDAAGESFNERDILSITPYIAHSEAVILILDPRQLDKLDNAITSHMPNLPKVSDVTYLSLLDLIINTIRNDRRIGSKKNIDIPLCIAFSKWDLVTETPDLLPDGLMCSQVSQSVNKGYDAQRIDTISNEIRSLLMQQWGQSNLVNYAEQNFRTVKYSCFSAWGSSNSGNRGAPAIAPVRVEDPILWVMKHNKII